MKMMRAKKIGYDYYVFWDDKFADKTTKNTIWKALTTTVSAIQVLYGKNADVFFVRGLPDRKMLSQILLSDIPEEHLVARARYV